MICVLLLSPFNFYSFKFVIRTYLNAVRFLDGEHFAILLGSSDSHHCVVSWGLWRGPGQVAAMAENSER